MAKTKSGAKDARFRHREPVIWHGARAETLRHHRDGDRFVRPDLCAWVEGYTLRAERLVPPDAPDSVMADLLDEALARQADARGRAPTALVVLDHALAEVLRARFGDRFGVQVRAMGPADEYADRNDRAADPTDSRHATPSAFNSTSSGRHQRRRLNLGRMASARGRTAWCHRARKPAARVA